MIILAYLLVLVGEGLVLLVLVSWWAGWIGIHDRANLRNDVRNSVMRAAPTVLLPSLPMCEMLPSHHSLPSELGSSFSRCSFLGPARSTYAGDHIVGLDRNPMGNLRPR